MTSSVPFWRSRESLAAKLGVTCHCDHSDFFGLTPDDESHPRPKIHAVMTEVTCLTLPWNPNILEVWRLRPWLYVLI
jgi:hypothetical protein